MRVELVGAMGCGKTTLAKELQKFGAFWISEDIDSNPFLEPCYDDFETFKFPSQMWFALMKYKEIGMYDDPSTIYVHDQAVINNNAYTNLMYQDDFDNPARELVQQTFDYTEEQFGAPDVLVQLKCDPRDLLARIKQRGRPHEKDVNLKFLIHLENHIDCLVEKANRNGQEVILVSSDLIDFENDEDFVKGLYTQLETYKKEIQNGSSFNRHSNLESTA
jgi:deoxyadenosine/deoxycytidine kinase